MEQNLQRRDAEPGRPLMHEFIQLVDDFAEYRCINAFLSSSYTAIMSSHEPIRAEVIQGAKRCAELVQDREFRLKGLLDRIHGQYQMETENSARDKCGNT